MGVHLGGPRGGGEYGGMDGDEDEVVSEINTTPLVDIMLVLLIIFLITIPVATHAVNVDLPTRISHPTLSKPGNIALVIKGNGQIFWNEEPIADEAALRLKLASIASLDPQPQIQIWGDMQAKYDKVGEVMKDCQEIGIRRVDFITQPPKRG